MLKFVQRETAACGWEKPAGMDDTIYALLISRGVKSAEEAVAFLNPEAFASFDPFGFDGMNAAVQRISRAKEANEAVCVFGDYDVDGACATAIMLIVLRGLGIDAAYYIPNRAEGYGLSEMAVREIARNASLLITVDCGIASMEEVKLARSLSLDVIVTDHHQFLKELPDAIILHPALGRDVYPHFCGAGVAWMLGSAIDEKVAESVVDLAALATVADLVPLSRMNRAIVKKGLSMINGRPRPGIRALIEAAGLSEGGLTSENIAYQLAPRLNACGRLDSAEKSLALLLCEDKDEAAALARRLNEFNDERRAIENTILQHAREKLKDYDLLRCGAIVLKGDDWHAGVIGLVASRLVENYGLPAIVLSREAGGLFVGSCRSLHDIDMMDALNAASHLLERYGGHRQAAGLTIREENIGPFREAVNEYILKTAPPDAFVKRVEYDLELKLSKMTPKLIGKLKALEPFGLMNPEPVFLSKGRVLNARAVGKDGGHLQLRIGDEISSGVRAVWFRHGHLANELNGQPVTALYCGRLNEFRGATNVDLMLAALSEDAPLSEDRIREELPAVAFNFLTAVAAGQHCASYVRMAESELADAVHLSPRGTLVCAHSFRAASRFLGLLNERGLSERIDVYVGAWPADLNGMNALCIMPVGNPPDIYEKVCFLPGEAGEFAPAVDELREVLLSLRALLKRPYHFSGFRGFAYDLSGASGLPPEKCLASLVILEDMGLISVKINPAHCQILSPVKKNPEDNLAFIRLRALQ